MEAIALFGLWNVVFPLFLWVPLFAIGAGLLGLSTLRLMRRRLVRAKIETRLPTALVGTLLLVILPTTAGILGGTFAFKRGVANAIERGGEEVISWSVSRGSLSLRAALGGSEKLSPDDVRALLKMYVAGDRSRPPWEQAFFRACDVALARIHHDVTWNELMVATRLALHQGVLSQAARPLRDAAQLDLIALGILLIVVHGGTLTIVWFVCRKRLTVVT
jgi:hypothetical protein